MARAGRHRPWTRPDIRPPRRCPYLVGVHAAEVGVGAEAVEAMRKGVVARVGTVEASRDASAVEVGAGPLLGEPAGELAGFDAVVRAAFGEDAAAFGFVVCPLCLGRLNCSKEGGDGRSQQYGAAHPGKRTEATVPLRCSTCTPKPDSRSRCEALGGAATAGHPRADPDQQLARTNGERGDRQPHRRTIVITADGRGLTLSPSSPAGSFRLIANGSSRSGGSGCLAVYISSLTPRVSVSPCSSTLSFLPSLVDTSSQEGPGA